MKPADRAGPRTWLLLPAAVLVLSGLAAGCSSSTPAYCTDAANLKTSVSNLGNVDVAKNGLSSLQTALNSVKTNATSFATDAKSAYPSQTAGTEHRGVRPADRDHVGEGPASADRGHSGRVIGIAGEELGQHAAKRHIRHLLVTRARRGEPRDQGVPRMAKWNLVAMGQVGLTGWTRVAARPVARAVARRTGRPETQILALIGAGFLAIALIDFLREVDAVIAAGRTWVFASR